MDEGLILRPRVAKTLVKGTIAVGLFSMFLQVNSSNLTRYFLFLVLYYASVAFYMYWKHAAAYTIGDEGITLKGFWGAPQLVPYSSITDISLAQGFLARRFRCGTVFVDVKESKGSVVTLAGGRAEALRDVSDPARIAKEISSRLSRF
jgi:membrane protein YdbS with pleckstrin-like domain